MTKLPYAETYKGAQFTIHRAPIGLIHKFDSYGVDRAVGYCSRYSTNEEIEAMEREPRPDLMRLAIDRIHAGNVVYTGDIRERYT